MNQKQINETAAKMYTDIAEMEAQESGIALIPWDQMDKRIQKSWKRIAKWHLTEMEKPK